MAAEATYPVELLYHPEHDWAKIDGDTATFGVTWFAQNELGEIVFCDLPDVGRAVTQGEPYAELESVKAVSDVIAPLSGEVLEVNGRLSGEPGEINNAPHTSGWLVRVRLTEPEEVETLLAAESYQDLIA